MLEPVYHHVTRTCLENTREGGMGNGTPSILNSESKRRKEKTSNQMITLSQPLDITIVLKLRLGKRKQCM